MSGLIKNDINLYLQDLNKHYASAVVAFKRLSNKKGLAKTFDQYIDRSNRPYRIIKKLEAELKSLAKDDLIDIVPSIEEVEEVETEAFEPEAADDESFTSYTRHTIPPIAPSFIKDLFSEYKRIVKRRSHLHAFLFDENKEEKEVLDIQVEIWNIAHRENEIWEAINQFKKDGTLKMQANLYYKQGVKDRKRLASIKSLISQAKRKLKTANEHEQSGITSEIKKLQLEYEELKQKTNG